MATSKPRITITLTDEQHRVLQGLADLQRVSMSSIVVDVLDTAMPSLERLNALLEVAEEAPKAVLDGLRSSLNAAGAELGIDLRQLDLLRDAPGANVRGARALAPGASKAAKMEGPPSTNRGVRIPPSKSLKPSAGAASRPVRKGSKK